MNSYDNYAFNLWRNPDTLKSRKLKKRNPLVVPAVTKSGAGKHTNKKKETKDLPIKDSE